MRGASNFVHKSKNWELSCGAGGRPVTLNLRLVAGARCYDGRPAKKRDGLNPFSGIEPVWLRGLDLNQRPLGYEPNELPDCSTPRKHSIRRRARLATK
jgi:hypothetical protein